MPYILSPFIKLNSSGMWMEGPAYEKKTIYKIEEGKLPPVNYDEHTFRSHSLTHAESSLHVLREGKDISHFFVDPSYFFGGCVVVRLQGDNYKLVDEEKNIYHWNVTLEEIKHSLNRALANKTFPGKILLTTEKYPMSNEGYHDPNYVLTLTLEAAQYLVNLKNFNLFGTSWKSSDFMPGSIERPIHKKLFEKAIILELLDLKNVPEGIYFFSGAPLPIVGASESPICPMLFRYDEIIFPK